MKSGRKLKFKMKWVVIGALVVLAAAAAIWSKSAGTSAEVVTVSKGEVKQYLEETARVLSKNQQTVYVEGSGIVADIKVDAGDTVKQGDLLLSLDKSDLELQLKNAQAGLEAAKAQLAGTELASYANRIELAKSAVSQAQIAYATAERNYANAKDLYDSGALSKEEYATSQDAYKAAAAALETANLQLADVEEGAPAYVKQGYKAQLEQAVVSRDAILRNIQKLEVRAPVDGVVLERLIEKNMPAAPFAPVFVIGDVKELELETDILSDDANTIKLGDVVEITGKPLGGGILQGKVTKIAPSAKTITSSLGVNQKRVPVTIDLSSGSSQLKPGYSVDIKIITEVKKDAITVPDTAVFDYKGESAVFKVVNGKAVLGTVKKGIESGDVIEITEGLSAGESILVKPDDTIKEGAKITPLNVK